MEKIVVDFECELEGVGLIIKRPIGIVFEQQCSH